MTNITQVDVKYLNNNGYLVLKGVFSKTEMRNLRDRLQTVKHNEVASNNYKLDPLYPKVVFILGDLLSKNELKDLDYVIFDRRIIACAKQVLGQNIVYFGDSSIQTGEGTRGFHKDNVDRYDISAPDWQSDYTLIRFAIYLQDHARYSGGVKVRVTSHRYASHHRGKALNVKSELGDVVAWNLRTTHSGNNVRLRGFPNLCLHPRIERIIPPYLRVPEEQERIAIFCTFGAMSGHLDRYIQNMIRRGDYHEYWERSGFNRDILELANARGVEIRRPIREYGSLYPYYEECGTVA